MRISIAVAVTKIFHISQGRPRTINQLCIGAMILCGLAGLFSGAMVVRFRLPPFIATLAMMQVGRLRAGGNRIKWCAADALDLPFEDARFDAVTSGFLMRNVIDVKKAFVEQMRVTKPGGWVVVLESSPPKENLLRPFILFHLNVIIPALGRLVTGEMEAYRYLPDSTQQFRDPDSLAAVMHQVGFEEVDYKLFMFGTIAVHVGQKPA